MMILFFFHSRKHKGHLVLCELVSRAMSCLTGLTAAADISSPGAGAIVSLLQDDSVVSAV